MTDESSLGSRDRAFPSTLWSEILALRDASHPEWAARMEQLARRYWRPIYAYVRLRWRKSSEEAKDLTQEFFVKLLEENTFKGVEAGRSRFRTFVRSVLDNFIRDCERSEGRVKRGGGRAIASLDAAEIEQAERRLSENPAPEEALHREWRRRILEESMARLEESYSKEGAALYGQALRRYYFGTSDGSEPTYESVARDMGLSVFDVTNLLNRARARLRQTVLQIVRETVSDPEGLRMEMKDLFGKDAV